MLYTGLWGSPPHVRGKELRVETCFADNGITPACAGKSNLFVFRRIEPKDHPRMCGEKLPLPAAFCVPARDHPRMCGEKPVRSLPVSCIRGSPPHVRGKVARGGSRYREIRITPACAGKRRSRSGSRSLSWDHPRMCGEKTNALIARRELSGSPPHVRGKVTYTRQTERFRGITPACAGKRLKRSRSTVSPVAIVPLFPSVCNKPVVSDGSPAGRDAPLFLPAENAVPASPAYNLRSL